MSDDLLPGPLDAVTGGLIASAVTWAVVRARAARAEALAHSERVFDLNDDMRRWIRDRDRWLRQELVGITNLAGAGKLGRDPPPEGSGSQLYSGAHVRELAAAKERALHEYRDEPSGSSANSARSCARRVGCTDVGGASWACRNSR